MMQAVMGGFIRFVAAALIAAGLVAAALAPARAAPPARPAPSKPQLDELAELDKEYSALVVKQANYAAIKVVRKAIALQIKATGGDSQQVTYRKQTLAGLLGQVGDYRGQLALYQEMLAAATKAHGPESREVLTTLMFLAGPYWSMNRFEDLEGLTRRTLELTKKLDGERSQPYANELTSLGSLLTSMSQYASAQLAYEQSLQIQESLTTDETMLLGPIEVLANAYWQANQHARAQALFDRAIAISEKPGTPVATRGGTLWMIIALYHYGGRDDLAQPLVVKAIDLYQGEVARLEREKPDGYELPLALGQLGFTYRQAGDLARAEEVFERVVALDDKRSGYSSWASTLAEIKRTEGKPKEALVLLEHLQDGLRKVAPRSVDMFDALIADVLREIGDYPRAERLMAQYRATIEKSYGRRHPTYGMAELSTAYIYMMSGKLAQAEQMLADGLELAERDLQLVLKTGTEADHQVYFARYAYQLDLAINFQLHYAPHSGSAGRIGLTTLLRHKGRVLDAAAASMTTIRARLSPADKQLLDDLANARAQLAKLMVAGPTATGDEAELAKQIAAFEEQIQKLEIEVGKKSAAYRAASQPIVLSAIQKAIPSDAKLVEIVNFLPGDPGQPYAPNRVLPPRGYAAYVVGRTGDPQLIDLGPATAIDEAIEQFRKAVSDPDNDRAGELGHALYALTMAKVVPALGGSTSVLISPDGALNLVPFSALVDDHGDFLVKRYTFTYLTSGRDLLRLGVKTKAQGGGVIFANPAFDATAPKAAADPPATRGRRSADLAQLMWSPLPGTGQEAAEVKKHLRGAAVFLGPDATETALKAVRGPKVLHLATHGFFLPDAPPPAAPIDPQLAGGGPAAGAPGAPTLTGEARENPLLRSGLALAGANQLKSGDDDGILTAMEATGLDLWGTQLVVLSACETGVGKVTNGDGVYGLRRALVIAGAESLMMSLWQVDDAATRDLMAGYYTRLSAGVPRSSALRDIQLEIQRTPKYAHPYYWASFLAAGENTPIQ